MNRSVAIHQPNFLPWLGYFDKLLRSDVFVVLDDAQFSKTGGTWSNRVRIAVSRQAAWITMPVVRSYHGLRKISEMKIDNSAPWRGRLLRTVERSYREAPRFADVFPWISDLVNYETDDVCQYNLFTLRGLMSALGLDPSKLVLASSLDAPGTGTARLIRLVQAVGGTSYLCGGGASGYQDDALFEREGIRLTYQAFASPVYPQVPPGEFIPGLSVVDALLNCGKEGTRGLLEAGRP